MPKYNFFKKYGKRTFFKRRRFRLGPRRRKLRRVIRRTVANFAERKNVTIGAAIGPTNVSTTLVGSNTKLLDGMAQGVTQGTHIGTKVRLKSVTFQYLVEARPSTTLWSTSTGASQMLLRCMVLAPRPGADITEIATFLSTLTNLDTQNWPNELFNLIKVLKDWKFPVLNMYNSTAGMAVTKYHHKYIKFKKRFNDKELRFSSATPDEPNNYQLWFITRAISDTAGNVFNYEVSGYSIARYVDV